MVYQDHPGNRTEYLVSYLPEDPGSVNRVSERPKSERSSAVSRLSRLPCSLSHGRTGTTEPE